MAKEILAPMSQYRGLGSPAGRSMSSASTPPTSTKPSNGPSNGSISEKHIATTATNPSTSLPKAGLRRRRPIPSVSTEQFSKEEMASALKSSRPWLLLALSSGAFAALNGAFAKLTTTSLTSTLTNHLAALLSIPIPSTSTTSLQYRILDIAIRGFFFVLNLVSNGIMWALFTRALTAHSSATQVSILNTSANFLVTALLGVVVFAERLGGLWFAGAACLVAGNVVIGRKALEKEDDKTEEEGGIVLGGGDTDGGGDGLRVEEEGGENEWDALLELDGDEDEVRAS